jgi:inner membrane protein
MQEDHYYEVFTSVFDRAEDVSITRYETDPSLLASIQDKWEVQRLIWFTKGAYSVRQEEKRIILSDLRMGMEGAYVFTFEVGQISQNGRISTSDFAQVSRRPDISDLPKVFQRIIDPSIKISP